MDEGGMPQLLKVQGGRGLTVLRSQCLTPDVLDWLLQDPSLDNFNLKDFAGTLRKEGSDKVELVFALGESPQNGTLNGDRVSGLLPLNRLRAWVGAFKVVNDAHFANMQRNLRRGISTLADSANKEHFVKEDWRRWLCAYATMQLRRGDGDVAEPCHYDGGASIFHLSVTLSGRRKAVCVFKMVCFPRHG